MNTKIYYFRRLTILRRRIKQFAKFEFSKTGGGCEHYMCENNLLWMKIVRHNVLWTCEMFIWVLLFCIFNFVIIRVERMRLEIGHVHVKYNKHENSRIQIFNCLPLKITVKYILSFLFVWKKIVTWKINCF